MTNKKLIRRNHKLEEDEEDSRVVSNNLESSTSVVLF